MATNETAKILIDNVVKRYPLRSTTGESRELTVLNEVAFEVQQEEFLSIIGPSGCGKTTLLRIIAGLTDYDGGQIRIDGAPIQGPGPDRATVFQSFGLFPWKTVRDNVAFPLEIRNLPKSEIRERCDRFLELVGLSRFGHSYPHQLSGGMQQRVGIARALATDPEILLMDEPFGSIDAQTREFMQEEIVRLWDDRKKTVVFVTHDLDEAIYLSDRIVVLTRGPGHVRATIDVDLPRPRWDYDVRGHPRFAEVRRQIWSMLRGDLLEEEKEAGIDVHIT